ncbi:hypothetical protein MRX96_039928 [Rhipicephalus microplus]
MAASTKTGYDPSTMQWVDIEVAETREDPIPGEDEYLHIMVRQLQEKLAKMNPRGSTAATQPQARKTGSTPAACFESPRKLATWKPTHTPRIRSDELVIVLKPKLTMDLHAAFGPGGIGTAVQRFTGSNTNAGISAWPVWDQNIVVVGGSTKVPLKRSGRPEWKRDVAERDNDRLPSIVSRNIVVLSPADLNPESCLSPRGVMAGAVWRRTVALYFHTFVATANEGSVEGHA